MKLNLNDRDIATLRTISYIAIGFTFIIALTMIFSFVQLKVINPVDNPVLLQIKEQYDKDPANTSNAEQVRVMDLMARKAYFSARWQVETGSYLLILGAVVFIICQRIISGNEKTVPVIPGSKPDMLISGKRKRQYVLIAATLVFFTAVAASFIMRGDLPDTREKRISEDSPGKNSNPDFPEPDKTNYPFFRGQGSRGIAGGKNYPVEWNGEQGTNIKWKTAIPKHGQSSPVIWGDKIFLTGSDGTDCEIYCIDKKSGEIIWTGNASGIAGEPSALPQMDQENGLATSTVAANENSVCAVFANGNLVCFDHDGKMKWSRNLGVPANVYGYSSSLAIFGDLVMVQFDSDSKISLIGVDIQSGETKWETIRNGHPVWSSPVLANFSGQPQVIINGNPYVSSYDVVTGKELWSVECLSGDVAPSVAVNSTMAYAVTDYAKLAAIKGGTGASIIWEDNTFTPDVSSPVANDKYLFVSTGTGDVACYNAQKGDTLWTHYFDGQFYASPIIAGENLYLLDRSGVMHIVKAEDSFKLVSESALGERADCTPAFSDSRIYIRGKENLYCIAED
jgi:outer membrane protein assembly factor BamB